MSWGALIEQSLAADLVRILAIVFAIGLLIGAAAVLLWRRSKR